MMIKKFSCIISVFACLCSTYAKAQITVTPNQTASTLANDLIGSGITVLNPTLTCASSAEGLFSGNSGLGIDSGILLTTGSAAAVHAPAYSLASQVNETAGDASLTALSVVNTFDACKLEFDFIPQGDSIKFDYIFGSEEYPEFACSNVNDVFAFFISGPGYSNPTNIALLPGTSTPISINTVNNVCANSQYYVNNSGNANIVYDGRTTLLTALASVTPCDTYHLKLAIADGGDKIYDSGVFLKKGSLSSNNVTVSTQGGSPDSINFLTVPSPYVVRDCLPGKFKFTRPQATGASLTVHYLISGTAVNGTDYTFIPDSVTIPANNTTAYVAINPLGGVSGTKNVKLYIYGLNACNVNTIIDSVSLDIYDSLAVSLNNGDTAFCGTAQPVAITGIGDALITYQWSPATGLSSTNTLNTTATAATTQTYTLTASLAGSTCPAVHKNITITVNPVPALTPENATICSGTATDILLNGTVPGALYSWQYTATNATGAAAGTGTTAIAQTLNSSNNNTGTVIYTITPSVNGCNGLSVTDTVTVNPVPVATLSTTLQNICSGTATAINPTVNVSGSTFTWTVSAAASITGAMAGNGNAIVQTLNNTGTSPAQVIYTITPTVNGCSGAPIYDTVMVNPPPVASLTPTSQTICSGIPINIIPTSNVSGSTFTWTVSAAASVTGVAAGSGTTISQTLTNTGTSPAQVIYTITPAANGCIGTAVYDTVTVNPAPVAGLTSTSQAICSGGTTDIEPAANVPGSNFGWTVSAAASVTGAAAGSGTTISQTLTNTGTSPAQVIYTITPAANGCIGTAIYDTVMVNPTPVAGLATTSQTICNGIATNIIPTSNVSGSTFTWTVSTAASVTGATAGNGTTIAQMLYNTDITSASVIYTITPTANGCIGGVFHDTVMVNPMPVASLTSTSQAICSGGTTGIAPVINVSGSTFTWTVSAAASIAGAAAGSGNTIVQTLTNTGTSPAQVIYTITPTANGCNGLSVTDTVTVTPVPVATLSTTLQNICSGTATAINPTVNVSGSTFTWTVSTAASVTGAAAGSGTTISQTLTNTGTSPAQVIYTITPAANGCIGIAIYDTVTVNPTPVADLTSTSQTICNGIATNINPTVNVSGSTFTWTVSAAASVTGVAAGSGTTIAQTLTNTGTSPAQVIYTITPTANGCIGTAIYDTVTVNPTPVAGLTSTSQTICNGIVTNITPTSNISGSTFTWTVNAAVSVTGAAAGSGATIAQPLTNSGISPAQVIYTITPAANGCSGTPVQDTVTVNPVPAASLNITSTAICSGGITGISPTATVAGSTFNWTVNAAVSVTGAAAGSGNTIAQTLTNSGTSPAQVIYTITPAANGCSGTPVHDTVTVYPVPDVITTNSADMICNGNTVDIHLSGGVLGTSFSWTATATSNITGASGGTGNLISQTLNNSMISQGNVVYSITPIANGCPGLVKEDTITVSGMVSDTFITDTACGSIVFNGQTYTSPASFTDTVYFQSGCDSLYRHISLTVFPQNPYSQTTDSLVCDHYEWKGITYFSDNTFMDTVYSIHGCDSIYQIFHFTVDTFRLYADVSLDTPYQNETFLFQALGNGYTYQITAWAPENLFSDQHSVKQYMKLNESSTIRVIGIDQNGCTDTLEKEITVLPYNKAIAVPNAFSPNGDGLNDLFRLSLVLKRAYQVVQFSVFNRLGQPVFHSSGSQNVGWDGTYNGKPCPVGTYYYFIRVAFQDGTTQDFKGDVTLLR